MADVQRFVPLEAFAKVATSTDGTNNYVDFTLPYTPTGYIANIFTVTTGALKAVTSVVVTGSTIRVSATDIVTGDIVSLIAIP